MNFQVNEERFDLKLVLINLLKDMKLIVIITILASLLSGGFYCLYNYAIKAPVYESKQYYKLTYTIQPVAVGDYYINENTWNIYADTSVATAAVMQILTDKAATDASLQADISEYKVDEAFLREHVTMRVESDWFLPCIIADTNSKALSEAIAGAYTVYYTGEFLDTVGEVAGIEVASKEQVKQVLDARPVSSFVLGAVLGLLLSLFTAFIYEVSQDFICLPDTVRRRYGLKWYICDEISQIAFANSGINFEKCAVISGISDTDSKAAMKLVSYLAGDDADKITFLPAPDVCPEVIEKLKDYEEIIPVFAAENGEGAHIEYFLELMAGMDIEIKRVIFSDVDMKLFATYYKLSERSE